MDIFHITSVKCCRKIIHFFGQFVPPQTICPFQTILLDPPLDVAPSVLWVIPCEITQKSAISTPTPFDFGENWWTYSTPWPKHVRTILALGDLSGQI